MLEQLSLFRLTFVKRDPVIIAASGMQEALSLATKLPNYVIGEVTGISIFGTQIWV